MRISELSASSVQLPHCDPASGEGPREDRDVRDEMKEASLASKLVRSCNETMLVPASTEANGPVRTKAANGNQIMPIP